MDGATRPVTRPMRPRTSLMTEIKTTSAFCTRCTQTVRPIKVLRGLGKGLAPRSARPKRVSVKASSSAHAAGAHGEMCGPGPRADV